MIGDAEAEVFRARIEKRKESGGGQEQHRHIGRDDAQDALGEIDLEVDAPRIAAPAPHHVVQDQESAEDEEKIDAHPAVHQRNADVPSADREQPAALVPERPRRVTQKNEDDGDGAQAVEGGDGAAAPRHREIAGGPAVHAVRPSVFCILGRRTFQIRLSTM